MESPSTNNAPAGATDEFWAFNPQQPPPAAGGGDDTSLDELLALYQTAQDAPAGAPFAPMGEPDSYPGFGGGMDFNAGFGGDPATDQPFPGAAGADPFAGGFDFGGSAGADPFAAPAGADPFAAAPAADAFGAPADFGAPAGDFGMPGADPFAAPVADAFGAPVDFGAPADAGFDFGAPAADPFGGAPAAHPEGDFAFDAPAMPDLAPPMAAPFGGDHAADTTFGAANAEASADAFGGVDPFAGADPFAAPPEAAAAGGLDDLFGGDAGPVFPAFDEAPAATAQVPAAAPAEELQEFMPDDESPLFPALDEGPVFGPIDDTPPAAAAAAPTDDLFGGGEALPTFDEGPVFEPFDDTPPAPKGAMPTPAAEPVDELFGLDAGPVFPALDEGPVFEPFDDTPPAPKGAAHAAPAAEPVDDLYLSGSASPYGGDAGPVFEPFDDTPPAPPTEAPSALPGVAAAAAGAAALAAGAAMAAHHLTKKEEPDVTPAIDFTEAFPEAHAPKGDIKAADPDATLRFKEVPAEVSTPAAPALDPAALAALTGREVVVKSADDRKNANQQLSQVLGSVNGQLDELQTKLANLYAELQRAAVRRASVTEINDITAEMGRTRAQLAEGSEVHKQVMYLRQLADAYAALLQEL